MPSSSSQLAQRRSKAKKPESRSPPSRIFGEPSHSFFPSRGELLKLLLVVFIAASAAVACNLVSSILSRRPKPFCHSGLDTQDLDICEPCPEKGRCSNGKLECLHGYEKHGRICIENRQLHQKFEKLVKVVEVGVCRSYAQVLCDRPGKIWFEESDLMKILHDHKEREDIGIEDDAYKLAVHKALETVQGLFEIKMNSIGDKEYKCPELLVVLHKSLVCCTRQWLHKHIIFVTGVFTIIVCLSRFFWILYQKWIICNRAEKLYEEVCEILEENAMTAKTQNDSVPWVVASWLRDHLLLPRERRHCTLWKKVEELIQEDSRINQYPKLIKGEPKTVFEWQADGSLSCKMNIKRSVKKADDFGSQADRLRSNQLRAKLGEPT